MAKKFNGIRHRGVVSPPTHVRLGEYDLMRTDDGASPIDVAIKQVKTHEGCVILNL